MPSSSVFVAGSGRRSMRGNSFSVVPFGGGSITHDTYTAFGLSRVYPPFVALFHKVVCGIILVLEPLPLVPGTCGIVPQCPSPVRGGQYGSGPRDTGVGARCPVRIILLPFPNRGLPGSQCLGSDTEARCYKCQEREGGILRHSQIAFVAAAVNFFCVYGGADGAA